MANQTPEERARDLIDQKLVECGWTIQEKTKINLNTSAGVAVKEYQTKVGPADYILFIDKVPVGVIEAKKEAEGVHLTMVEDQSSEYATSKLKYFDNDPLRFVYESTGSVTRFTDYKDPKPRSRPVFTFHRPETFLKLLKEEKTLRSRFFDFSVLRKKGLYDCQFAAITNLENSFRQNRPRALLQMATGSGKTFTAVTFIYRLLKYAKAKRILFVVDTKNLGEQAESEFKKYEPQDDNRLFTELYGVTRLNSSFIPGDSQVYISTIQRLYSILKGTELDEREEEENPNEKFMPKEPMPVVYNEKTPMEFFDFIIIDECHRSIYNLWKQVLDYFDAFQIGLTATPDNRTFGYFNQNLVSDYGYQQAVIDGILVPYNVFEIQTKITKEGSKLEFGEYVEKRERQTRKKFWSTLDEDIEYNAKQLDDKVVNLNQIRLIIKTVKENLPKMFPDRYDANNNFEVPKTLIFAKTDSHADDIINIVREEFAEENQFCKKITYKSEEDPKSVLQQFRNSYYPRIAVTVDMIATGTDIRPLEILLFMRDVKSRSYYEQMKGRGTRNCSLDELRQKGTPSAKYTKDHFVIIDAIGVEGSQKTDSRPLEKKPGMSLKEVLERVNIGQSDEDLLSTLANRLIRLEKQISDKEKISFKEKSKGKTISQVVKQLLNVYDPDTIENEKLIITKGMVNATPVEIEQEFKNKQKNIIEEATAVFNDPELRNFVIDVRKKYDQIIDTNNTDRLINVGWKEENKTNAANLINEFTKWIEEHKAEITALQIFYSQPYRRRELTFQMIKDLVETIKSNRPALAPLNVWRAYEQIENVTGQTKNELIAIVSLIRKVCGIDENLTSYDKTVDKNFQDWVFRKQAGILKYTEEQMQWLRMIKEYVATSFHIEKEDFDLSPFNANGGLGKMWKLFGDKTEEIITELNEVLAA